MHDADTTIQDDFFSPDAAGVAPEVYGLAYASVIGMARASWNLQ